MYDRAFSIVWIATTVGCGMISYYGTNGAWWPTFGGVILGWVLGMVLGLFLPLLLVLAGVAGVTFLILNLLR